MEDNWLENSIKELEGQSAVELIRFFDDYRKEVDAESEALKVRKALVEVLKAKLIPEQMESEDIESIRVTGVGTAYLSVTYRASIKGGMKEEAYEWLRENGLGDLITDTVHAGTLSASMKERAKKEEVIPEDIFRTFAQTRVSIKKA